MKYFSILFYMLLVSNILYCQSRPISLRTVTINNLESSIEAMNTSYANYTLHVNFTSLQGYTSSLQDNAFVNVSPHGKSQVSRIIRDKTAGMYSFQYRYTYYTGVALYRIPDTNFVYLLPSTPGNIVRVNKVGSLNVRLGIKEENTFYGNVFTFHYGDTVCAARGGIIIELLDQMQEGEMHNQVYNANRNRIKIEQKDGTIAVYSFLSPIQSLIQLGDKVNAGQPLALLNKESEKYVVMLSTEYLDEKKLAAYCFRNDMKSKPDYQITLPMKFHLS